MDHKKAGLGGGGGGRGQPAKHAKHHDFKLWPFFQGYLNPITNENVRIWYRLFS
jgi:hypothetical protein